MTRSIVFAPLNKTCTKSGKTPTVASFQPPSDPQTMPARSPLLTAATG
jgi:hypothetical protein